MNSLQSTILPEALVYIQFTLLKYAPNICPIALLLHSTYKPQITAQIRQISLNCNIYLPHYHKIYAKNKYALKYQKYCICLNDLTFIYGGSMPVYLPDEKLLLLMV